MKREFSPPYEMGHRYKITVTQEVTIPLVDGPQGQDVHLSRGQELTGTFLCVTRAGNLRAFKVDEFDGTLYFERGEISAFPIGEPATV